jgi:hypothetical protein
MWCDGAAPVPRQDSTMMEISAMAWDAKVIEPSAAEDVTILMRVTYHSIESLCGDLFDGTESVQLRPC